MALVSVNEAYAEAEWNDSAYPRTARRVFIACFDADTDMTYEAGTAVGIPAKFDAHPKDATLLCKGPVARLKSAEQGKREFTVTCEYTGNYVSIKGTNPLNDPQDASWGMTEFSEVFNRDLMGKPVANSAGQLFPGQERPFAAETLRLTKNLAAHSRATGRLYFNAVNSDIFTADGESIPVGEALMKGITADKVWTSASTYYYRTTYEIWFRPTRIVNGDTWSGWAHFMVDQGMMVLELDVENGGFKLVHAIDRTNNCPVSEPILLQGSGTELAIPAPPAVPTPHELVFDRFPLVAFSPLGLT